MTHVLRRPPRHAAPPVLGNSLSAFLGASEFFVAGYRRYGPAFRITLMGEEYVVLAGEEMLEFFSRGGERHLDREAFFGRYAAEMGDPNFILTKTGPEQLRLRRMLSLGFSRQVAGPFVSRLAANVRARAEAGIGNPVSVMGFLTRVFLEHYGQLFAARSLEGYYRDALVFAVTSMVIGAHSLPRWSGRWLPLSRRARRRMTELVKAAVAERREIGREDSRYTVIDALLTARDSEGQGLADEAVVGGALHGLVGCMFYSTRMAGFLLYDLLSHPDLVQGIVQEIDDVCANDPLDITMLRSLPLLRAALTESQRLHPVSVLLPYDAKEDFAFEDMQIRKGEQVLLCTLTGNFSERYFRRPYVYDASRCLPPRNEHAAKGAMHPYGLGKRACNAIGLVETMIFSTVVTLFREFAVSMDPPKHVLKTIPCPLPAPHPGFRLLVKEKRRPVVRKQAASREARMQAAAMMAGVGEWQVLDHIFGRAELAEYDGGVAIIRQGDAAGHFYILLEGTVDVFQEADGPPRFLRRLESGMFFGEIGLLAGVRRTATVRSTEDQTATVLVLSREDFMELVAETDLISDEIAAVVRRRYLAAKLADAIPKVDLSNTGGLLDDIEMRTIHPGEAIVHQGDPAEEFFIVSKGHVEVVVSQEEGTSRVVRHLGPGDFFGEAGILQQSPRTASVKACDTEEVELLVIRREAFERMVSDSPGALDDIALRMAQRVVSAFKRG